LRKPLRQLFLAETGRFAPSREAVALCWHYAISDLGRLLAPIGVCADQRRACDIFAAVLRNSWTLLAYSAARRGASRAAARL